MALIKCKECGKNISDTTPACIHCGLPIEDNIEEYTNDNNEKIESAIEHTFLLIVIAIFLTIILIQCINS